MGTLIVLIVLFMLFFVRVCIVEKGVKCAYLVSCGAAFFSCGLTAYFAWKIMIYAGTFLTKIQLGIIELFMYLFVFLVLVVLPVSLSFLYPFRLVGKCFVCMGFITQEQYQRNFFKHRDLNHDTPSSREDKHD